jgi:hypothetical protein
VYQGNNAIQPKLGQVSADRHFRGIKFLDRFAGGCPAATLPVAHQLAGSFESFGLSLLYHKIDIFFTTEKNVNFLLTE